MDFRKLICPLVIAGSLIGTSSCNNTKYLPANESLYIGAKINVEAPHLKKGKKKTIRKELQALTRPKPNSSILGLRPKLWLWNIGGNPKRKYQSED